VVCGVPVQKDHRALQGTLHPDQIGR